LSAPPLLQTLEDVKTVLHKPHSAANFAYDRVEWQLKVRKEVFSPAETVRSPAAVNLIFCQVRLRRAFESCYKSFKYAELN
jgi:hypothetical protein